MYIIYVESQKSWKDHFLEVVFNEESHCDLLFSPLCQPYTVMKLRSQTIRSTCPPPVTPKPKIAFSFISRAPYTLKSQYFGSSLPMPLGPVTTAHRQLTLSMQTQSASISLCADWGQICMHMAHMRMQMQMRTDAHAHFSRTLLAARSEECNATCACVHA